MSDWKPIETAPRDGRTIEVRYLDWSPFHARWSDNKWMPIEYDGHGHPTHWLDESDDD